MSKSRKIVDLEIVVRMTIPRAVSYADLADHYNNDPLQCAKELVESGGITGATDKHFEITSAQIKEQP